MYTFCPQFLRVLAVVVFNFIIIPCHIAHADTGFNYITLHLTDVFVQSPYILMLFLFTTTVDGLILHFRI